MTKQEPSAPGTTPGTAPDPVTDPRPVLVTGATGYVGGRLVPYLLERGLSVRAMGRSETKLGCRPWAGHENVALIAADVMQPETLRQALKNCRAAYYLVHSMEAGGHDFAERDKQAAKNFAEAAKAEGVERIIYLGGLGEDGPDLSRHLKSRMEVAEVLGAAGVPVTFLRAAMLIGSGSASFEILRYLVERLPVMLTPRWVHTENQPISIRDVLAYLAGCLDAPETAGKTFDIGGPDIVSYRELFDIYAEEAGLRKRLVIPIPFMSLSMSAWWLGFVTPVPAPLAKPLIHGLRNRVVCKDDAIRRHVPLEPTPVRQAVRTALERVRQQAVDTCFADAGQAFEPEWIACGDAPFAGGDVLEEGWGVLLDARPEDVWPAIVRLGGANGWYFGDALWSIRGWMDKALGGAGHERGRRDPDHLLVGDALDFWRILRVEEHELLLLSAEMKAPGEAILEFRLNYRGKKGARHKTELIMRPRFLPRGLFGHAYWWATWPLHGYLFRNMLRGMARSVEAAILEGPAPVPKGQGNTCAMRS